MKQFAQRKELNNMRCWQVKLNKYFVLRAAMGFEENHLHHLKDFHLTATIKICFSKNPLNVVWINYF